MFQLRAFSLLVLAGSWPSVVGLRRGKADNNAATVDLVVERHCENLEWLHDLSPEVMSRVKVYIYDKPGKSCQPVSTDTLPEQLRYSVEELKNVARDGHDQLQHIIEHYDDLGTHVAFVQAGFHWTLNGSNHTRPPTFGWNTQAAALNELIPKLSDSDRFLPLVRYSSAGHVQWQDKEDDTDPDEFPRTNIRKFATGWSDMYMRARELFAMFFGGTPCAAPPQTFTAGMQYIVHRDSLRRRPIKFWKSFQGLMVSCDPNMGYAFERLTTAVYNNSNEAVDPDTWPKVSFCEKNVDWRVFTTPLKRMETAEFWRKRWGCEPLSERLLHKS